MRTNQITQLRMKLPMTVRVPETAEYEGWALPAKAYRASKYHYFIRQGPFRWTSLCQQHGWGRWFVPEDREIRPGQRCPHCERLLGGRYYDIMDKQQYGTTD